MKRTLTLFVALFVLGPAPAARSAEPAASNENYRVGVDDVLEINILRPEKLTATPTVGPDGAISFPYIGNVNVKGLTLLQIQEEVRRRLSDGYIRYPEVSAALKESRSKKFFISGEVLKPGAYPVEENTTLLKAISMAGGFSKAGSFGRGKIMRPSKGGQQTIPVVVKGGADDSSNQSSLPIRSGDTIIISEDKFFAYGDLAHPGTYPLEENTTVFKAISLVGGMTKYGSSSRVKVLRPRKNEKGYQTIALDMKSLMNDRPDSNVFLEPGDTLVVSEDKFSVYGAVVKPGTYPLEENMTVLKAISDVGGFTKYGSSNRVKVLRPKKDGPGYETIKVNLRAVTEGTDDQANILLEPGDTVVVSEGIF